MNVYSWETTARYVFDKTRFRLSIPYNHRVCPNLVSMCYIPQFNRIEIIGTVYNPETQYKLYGNDFLYGIDVLEKQQPKMS